MKALSVLKNPRLLVGIFVLAAGAAVFRYGHRLGLSSLLAKLVVVFVLLAIGALVVWLTSRKKKKESADIEKSLLLEADSLVMTTSGAQRAANERAREELVGAIEGLKKSKIADGRSGKAALSVLPWYLVFGRPSSGKSTMIRNSGLPRPGSRPDTGERAHGVGPGRSIQWWFTSHAVLLEANGRFVGKEDDVEAKGDWEGVLQVLRKSRPGTPLNGLIVSVSMEDIIRHDSVRLDDQARLLRQRLDAATEHLEAHCPLYLVVTKSDLVHGFEQFFRDLSGNARDQVFGATFSMDQLRSGEPLANFDREFEALYRSLCRRRVPRMLDENRPGPRGDVYLFPLEFQTLRRKLQRFVKTLVEPSPYGDSPMFRGFYFTSGNCEGEPVEMVVNEVSRVIGLPPDLDAADVTRFISNLPGTEPAAPAATPRRTEEEPRFLRELYTRVLLRDQELARPTKRALRARRTRRLALRIGGLSVVGLFAILMIVSFFRNRSLVKSTVELAQEASLVPPGGTTPSEIESALVQLDPLRERLLDLDRKDRIRGLTYGLGMYKGKSVNTSARGVYFRKLVRSLLGPSRAELESRLLSNYYPEPEEFGDWYRDYRAYRMLIEPDRAEPEFLADRLVRLWAGSESRGGATERLRDQLRLHVEYAWGHPNEVLFQSANAELPARDPSLVHRAGELIQENWQAEAYYDAMIEEVDELVPAFRLSSIPGAQQVLGIDPDSLATDPTVGWVPGSYTIQGWRDQISARIENSEEQLRTDWILKEAFEGHRLEMRDWLAAEYRKEYVAHWNRFLSAVSVPPLPGVQLASDRMRVLTGPSSPFLQLLEEAAANLTSEGAEGSPLASLDESYATLHSIFRVQGEGDEKQRPLDAFVGLERGVVESIRQLKESPDPAPASAEYAKKILGELVAGESPISSAIRFADRLGEDLAIGEPQCTAAVRTLMRRPAEGAWGSVMAEVQNHLDVLWENDVFEPFRPLAAKYPFVSAGSDAPLDEFVRFFSPNGVVSTFVDTELAPFLDRDGNPRVLYRYGLDLSPETREALRKGIAFRKAMFDNAGALSLRFRVKPSPTKRHAISGGAPPFASLTMLRIGTTQRLQYDEGGTGTEVAFTWPDEGRTGGARVSVVTGESHRNPEAASADGDWALFRVLARAEITARSDIAYDVRWRLRREDGQGVYEIEVPYEFTATSSVNPFSKTFFEYRCPRRLGGDAGSAP